MLSLIEIVFKNDMESLKSALSQGGDADLKDRDGRTALIHAAIDNKLDAAKLLLESRANADTQDRLGYTALHYAAQNYHPEMVSLLLSHRASVDAADVHGNTPLWRAVFNSQGRGDVIAILLGAGADPNRRNSHDTSPLELAHKIANHDVAKFFK